MNDLISRQAAISAICNACGKIDCDKMDKCEKLQLPPANCSEFPNNSDTISRQAAIGEVKKHYRAYDNDLLELITFDIERLPPAQPEQRWIPCSEQLPRQGQEVICQCRANMIKVLKLDAYGDWYQDANHCYMGGFVIAWMPLPEPYKEGEAI